MAFDVTTYATCKKYTDTKVAPLASGMTYKGSKSTKDDLPLTGNKKGDVWTVSSLSGTEFVWPLDSTSGTVDNWEELGGAGKVYSGGEGISVDNTTISAKIDNNSIQFSGDGKMYVYGKQDTLVSGQNIRTINGNSLLDPASEDITIKAHNKFEDINCDSLAELVAKILEFPDRTPGSSYIGGIEGDCCPGGCLNVECIITFTAEDIAMLTASSTNIAPYHWEYNTSTGDCKWLPYEIRNMDSRVQVPLKPEDDPEHPNEPYIKEKGIYNLYFNYKNILYSLGDLVCAEGTDSRGPLVFITSIESDYKYLYADISSKWLVYIYGIKADGTVESIDLKNTVNLYYR